MLGFFGYLGCFHSLCHFLSGRLLSLVVVAGRGTMSRRPVPGDGGRERGSSERVCVETGEAS